MAVLVEGYIPLEKLEQMVQTLKLKKAKGVLVNLAINDDFDQFEQNVVGYVKQSEEQRKAKKKRYYFLNGKVVWHDGVVVQKKEASKTPASSESAANTDVDDYPF